ncbi:MAG: DNA-processing protein DprA [Stackebrandtia sp.]
MSASAEDRGDRFARVALSALCEPGNAELSDLVAAHGVVEALERLLCGEASSTLVRGAEARLGGRDVADVVSALERIAETCQARVIVPDDPEWPARVDDLAVLCDEADPHTRPPICLWTRGRGDLAEALSRSASIVGARECTAYGRHVATELAFGLANRDWTVVSGGAYGVDAAAHRGALAGGGLTVAVLACGVDRPYPACNAGLFDSIVDTGFLVSEWPPGSTPQRRRFLVRNRVIAAATSGTVVVEAGLRSGARHTVRRAWELDRPVMIVPGPVTSEASAGVHQLARGPGETRIVTRAEEIVEDLGRLGADLAPPLHSPDGPRDRLNSSEAQILDAVPRRVGAAVERIAAQAGLPAAEARRVLPNLAARGLIERRDDRYRLAS